MAQEIFTLDKLKDFDGGRMLVAFSEEMKYAAQSCIDRPNDKSPRVVTLTLSLVPVAEPNSGACEGVKLKMKAKAKVPDRKSKEYDLGIKQTGAIVFSTNNPTNIRQRHIDDAIEEKGGKPAAAAKKSEVDTDDL